MRTKKSALNFAVTFTGQVIALFISIVARMAFLQYLNEEYLGLSGLFTNLLTMLSLLELGIGPAMSFSLYHPLANGDTEKVKSLMRLYRRAYSVIGIVVIALGVCFTPVYPSLIAEVPNIPNLNWIYLLFVANTGASYFFSYKRALVISDQNRYVASLFRYGFYIFVNAAQIVVLMLTKNYLLFLGVQVACTVLENIFLSAVVTKKYPYLREKKIAPLEKEDIAGIKKNVGAMIFHKVGTLVVNSTDSIVISKFIGLGAAGLYSNYQLVITAVYAFICNFFDSIVASIGNLNAQKKTQAMQTVFWRVFFINFWIYAFCSVCLAALFQPFISWVFGEKFLLSTGVVAALVVQFYINGMRQTALAFREASGAYYYDRYKPLFESAINLAASLWLVQRIGLAGVFIGTTISTVTTCLWVEPYVVCKHVLNMPSRKYFFRYALYGLITLAIGWVTLGVCRVLPVQSGFWLVVQRLAVCLVVPNALVYLLFRHASEFNYCVSLAKGFFKKK